MEAEEEAAQEAVREAASSAAEAVRTEVARRTKALAARLLRARWRTTAGSRPRQVSRSGRRRPRAALAGWPRARRPRGV
eukprot:scaffold57768_cov25-Tisochrysis_lutea.AAC.1